MLLFLRKFLQLKCDDPPTVAAILIEDISMSYFLNLREQDWCQISSNAGNLKPKNTPKTRSHHVCS